MPRPIYIIGSESGSEDKVTGLVSLYHVIDRIVLHNIPKDGTTEAVPADAQVISVGSLNLQVTAVWMRTSGDEDQEFEFETILYQPPDEKPLTVGAGTFKFIRPFHRLTAKIYGLPLFSGGGVLRIVNRI